MLDGVPHKHRWSSAENEERYLILFSWAWETPLLCRRQPSLLAPFWEHAQPYWYRQNMNQEQIWQAVKSQMTWASLVVQWLRICLLMQGTRVRALVWEDPTCRGAAGPVSHNYWAYVSGACAPQREAMIVRGPRTAMKSGPRLPQLEEALAQKRRPNTAINK